MNRLTFSFLVTKRTLMAIMILPFLCGTSLSQESLVWSAVKKLIRKKFSTVTQISTHRLAHWLTSEEEEKPVLLDARELKEYEVSHLQAARLAGSENAAIAAIRGLEKEHPIVVYCSVGYRSSQLATRLQTLGYKKVYNLEGSIFQWANEGRPVYSKGVKVEKVHPYNKVWGHLLNSKFWYKPKKDSKPEKS
ncbi:MAG: rhodanese-like domain-containing protein [Calditrichaeota bacterium]|nr:rhodanese-like domain-containing protein [Calditrichota bacterium]